MADEVRFLYRYIEGGRVTVACQRRYTILNVAAAFWSNRYAGSKDNPFTRARGRQISAANLSQAHRTVSIIVARLDDDDIKVIVDACLPWLLPRLTNYPMFWSERGPIIKVSDKPARACLQAISSVSRGRVRGVTTAMELFWSEAPIRPRHLTMADIDKAIQDVKAGHSILGTDILMSTKQETD